MTIAAQVFRIFSSSGLLTSTVLLDLAILFALSYCVFKVAVPTYRSYRSLKDLEEKAGPVPRHWWSGHNKRFAHTQEGLLKRAELTKTHPTIFHQWIAPFITIMSTHHPDSAAPVLSSGAPKNELMYGCMRPWIGDGLISSSGAKWQRNRHLLTPAFHFSVLKSYAKTTNGCVNIMLDKWKNNDGRALDVSNDITSMTLDNMLKCAMSSDTNCQNNRSHPYIIAVRRLMKIIVMRFQTPYLIPDFIFWRTSVGKEFQKHLKVVHSQGEKIIAERRTALKQYLTKKPTDSKDNESGFTFKRKLDFLDILLQTKDEHGNGLSNQEICDEVNTFLVAGHDTTASGISWGLYNLAKYPQIQEKCRLEVEEVLQDKEVVDWNDLSKFVYLTMFIKENMRLYPPVYAIGKKLNKPLTLRSKLNLFYETVVPAGSFAHLHIFALHRNELLWDNPTVFDPERFTKENNAKRSPHAYLPFSAGSRNCIGQNFAMNEMKIALAKTLQRYRLYLDGETPEPVMEPTITLNTKHGMFIKLESLRH